MANCVYKEMFVVEEVLFEQQVDRLGSPEIQPIFFYAMYILDLRQVCFCKCTKKDYV